ASHRGGFRVYMLTSAPSARMYPSHSGGRWPPDFREMMPAARRAGDRSCTNGVWGGKSRVNDNSGLGVDRDAEQLKALGYVSHFDRTMSKWENFSLGFTYLSPGVGVYTIFAGAFIAGGPPMWGPH